MNTEKAAEIKAATRIGMGQAACGYLKQITEQTGADVIFVDPHGEIDKGLYLDV